MRSRWLGLWVLLAAAPAMPRVAPAQTPSEALPPREDVAYFLGYISAVSELCPEYEVNRLEVGKTLRNSRLTGEDLSGAGPEGQLFREGSMQAHEHARSQSGFCAAAAALFGPSGTSYPGLLRPRDEQKRDRAPL